MSREDEISTGVVIGAGAAVGAAAYLLYRTLRAGGDGGWIGAGVGAGRWAGADASSDAHPIRVLVRPSATHPDQTLIEMNGEILSASDLVHRIEDGRRRDVIVAVRGDTREEGWARIRDALALAGIRVLLQEK